MKTKNHNQQENNFKKWSRKTIVILGLAALSVTTITANESKAQDLMQQDLATVSVDSAKQDNLMVSSKEVFLKKSTENTGEDAVIFNPNTVITSYVKTMEEVINDNKLVTDTPSDAYQPIVLEMSAEAKIAENNQIIEGNSDNEVYPLDFEKINRSLKVIKMSNNNVAIPVEIKL